MINQIKNNFNSFLAEIISNVVVIIQFSRYALNFVYVSYFFWVIVTFKKISLAYAISFGLWLEPVFLADYWLSWDIENTDYLLLTAWGVLCFDWTPFWCQYRIFIFLKNFRIQFQHSKCLKFLTVSRIFASI